MIEELDLNGYLGGSGGTSIGSLFGWWILLGGWKNLLYALGIKRWLKLGCVVAKSFQSILDAAKIIGPRVSISLVSEEAFVYIYVYIQIYK